MAGKSQSARTRYVGKVTSKGQTTVPKEVRDFLGLEEGTLMEWIVDDGKVIVKPRKLRAIDLAGMLGPPPSGVRNTTVEEMNEAIGDAIVESYERSLKQ
ncbi:MAG: AbrB/MazE/SpoVT family DNA-binding domain-containing protein [Devosia sp.]|uniref:AbrB/MazE/SpoVT family DNA-binding domain-containing protein n=1 Tax=Devosia sp. TaxID=1871048 RepID=UPI001AC153AD|nr:AbrB/MazE/SpoVT family DNA-binding domain-containing protein [Devosia sp.]MBN9317843.1 AbrB/MazE/SpoVT family DNA-binding domain-containing protein [Devosia sp.]